MIRIAARPEHGLLLSTLDIQFILVVERIDCAGHVSITSKLFFVRLLRQQLEVLWYICALFQWNAEAISFLRRSWTLRNYVFKREIDMLVIF